MVTRDLDVMGILVIPAETNTVLVVYSDAMLPGSITLQGLQAVAWWDPKHVKRREIRLP
jgi:hypothetical protein